jgi:hypothetical protein|tara:strand:- start:68 stop:1345 length:1278 start_codon:yes stop_codon:yes gene_type:complete
MINTNRIYRYSRPYSEKEKKIDGYHNYFYYTFTKGCPKPLLEKGINPIGDKINDQRVPAILINTNPLKSGSDTTPWMDLIDNDNGYMRYAGDNKPGSNNPDTPGNLSMIRQFELHQSNNTSDRNISAPIIVFENIQVGEKRKGFKKFLGYGIVKSIQRIIEYDRNNDSYYPNYVFEFIILDMANEGDVFNWKWISDRRKPKLTINKTLEFAPLSWKKWIKNGSNSTDRLQRKIYTPLLVPSSNQKKMDKRLEKLLYKIYHYYDDNKYSFEYLAAYVTEKVITLSGSNYKLGWITSKSSDGGIDYIGKISIGKNLSSVNIVVLGQAKCLAPTSTVAAIDLARTVARLQRGWIGSFVTSGIFSNKAQKEVYNDKYPLMLINGKLVAETVAQSMHIEKISSVSKFLAQIDSIYTEKVMNRRAEEIVYM